jgi:hypothetical protein
MQYEVIYYAAKLFINLKLFAGSLSDPIDILYRPSFQFASFKKDVIELQKEYELRKKIGFSIQFLDEKSVLEKLWLQKASRLTVQRRGRSECLQNNSTFT